jgi:hypothetical protein
MYTEASAPHHSGQKAGLISPQAPAGTYCLTFWYHMYGSQMGTLRVFARQGNNKGTPIWSRASNQGNQWTVAQVTVTTQAAWSVRDSLKRLDNKNKK